MTLTEEELQSWHRSSVSNRATLETITRCGCFCCCKTFPVLDIDEWVEDRSGDTAICPRCSVDSVVASEDPSVLDQMHDRFFQPG